MPGHRHSVRLHRRDSVANTTGPLTETIVGRPGEPLEPSSYQPSWAHPTGTPNHGIGLAVGRFPLRHNRHHHCSIAMACVCRYCILPPWRLIRSGFGGVRPTRWRGPKLPQVFRADVDAGGPPYALVQVTSLRPKAAMTDSSALFCTPHPRTREGPRPASPLVRGLIGTWWQVKDSNLRSFRDGFTVHSHWPLGQPARVRMEQ